jgi:hypothetical protein
MFAGHTRRLVVMVVVGFGQPVVHLGFLYQEKGRPEGRSFVRSIVCERLHVNAHGSADKEIRKKRELLFKERL